MGVCSTKMGVCFTKMGGFFKNTSLASVWHADADAFSAVACIRRCLRSQASYSGVQVKEGLDFYAYNGPFIAPGS